MPHHIIAIKRKYSSFERVHRMFTNNRLFMEYILHNWKSFYSMICGACVSCINRIRVFPGVFYFPRFYIRGMRFCRWQTSSRYKKLFCYESMVESVWLCARESVMPQPRLNTKHSKFATATKLHSNNHFGYFVTTFMIYN